MKILSLQHVEFESPAHITSIAQNRNYQLRKLKLYEEDLTISHDYDVLLIMGGPMNILDEESFPWLKKEKYFIKEAINKGKIVLGICLGSQLIASCLGAKVYKTSQKEIGWFPVCKSEDIPSLEFLPDIFTSFHWHGDTFDLPHGAQKLYSSDVTKNQAFVYNERVFAFQFHMEMDREGLSGLIANCRAELNGEGNIMDEEEIIKGIDQYSYYNHRTMENIFKYFHQISQRK